MLGMTLPARFVSAAGFAVCLTLAVGSAAAEEIATFNDWSAFRDGPRDRPVCYIGSVPKKEEGDYQQRGDTYVLITHSPGDGTHDVVSVTAGYDYQEGSEVEVRIDGDDFALFTKGANAWAYDAKGDKALVEAMRKGNRMVVHGTSSRGTLTTDTYSLTGFSAAHGAIDKACPPK